jgi:hypothetical protein
LAAGPFLEFFFLPEDIFNSCIVYGTPWQSESPAITPYVDHHGQIPVLFKEDHSSISLSKELHGKEINPL